MRSISIFKASHVKYDSDQDYGILTNLKPDCAALHSKQNSLSGIHLKGDPE